MRFSIPRENTETKSPGTPQNSAENMNQSKGMQSSLPDDIFLIIASSLQASDVCSLSSCSRFWRELCGSDCVWESLYRDRWAGADSSAQEVENSSLEGWRSVYIKKHNEMAGKAKSVVNFVEQCSFTESIEVGNYLTAIETLYSMKFGFKDVQMFFFKPKLNVLLNLIGLHYCISWLRVPAENIMEALSSCQISERELCVQWWKLGRWFYGFRLRDESHSRTFSLGALAMAKEEEVLGVLHRGAIHEVLHVQVSAAKPIYTPWSSQSSPTPY